ncbi:MAG: hypothetical protein ACLVIW_00695, partial [Bilophila wadsworthia]
VQGLRQDRAWRPPGFAETVPYRIPDFLRTCRGPEGASAHGMRGDPPGGEGRVGHRAGAWRRVDSGSFQECAARAGEG